MKSEQQIAAGIFASSVAHDINNILTILFYYCQSLTALDEAQTIHKDIQHKMSKAMNDLKSLAMRLYQAGKDKIESEIKELELPTVIKDVFALVRKSKDVSSCSLKYQGPNHYSLNGNETIFRQLILNLLLNAGKATGGNGRIEVHLYEKEDNTVIEVHDNGPGIPEEKRELIFQPNYTSYVDGRGLGLLSVKMYVESMNGKIDVTESHLGGACFQISIQKKGNSK